MLRPITKITSRRAALAMAGGLAGATVATWWALRKPPGPQIYTPLSGPETPPPLAPKADIVRTDPPHPPAAASFADAEGASHTLAEFAGRAVVLNMWATWCVPCVAELPALATLSKRLAGSGVVVLPLSSDRGGVPVVRRFLDEHKIDLPIWIDPKGDAARAWGARGIPTTLIIDRSGRELGRVEGSADWASDASVDEIRRLVG